MQLLAAVGALSRGTSLTDISPEFAEALPVLLGQLAGNALYEETFYRGFLIPAISRELGNRPWFAVMASGALFGLMHVPNYLARDLSLLLLVPAVLAGILFGAIYLRTNNLMLCIGLHALLNAPAALWDSAVPAVVAPSVVLFLVLAAGPRLMTLERATLPLRSSS